MPLRPILLVLCALLASCASSRPLEAGMSPWRPVHAFPDVPSAVPLQPVVKFTVTPLDATLRQLLARWAFEGGRRMVFALPMDWEVPAAAAQIRAATLEEGLASLTAAYAAQHLVFKVADGAVTATDGAVPEAAPAVVSNASQ